MKRRLSVLTFLALILFAPSAGAGEPGWPKSIAIGTASPGGTYYVYGQALAEILSGALGIEVTAEATQGSTRNIILLETGQATLGLITMGLGWEAWNGTGEWTKGRRFRAMRAILPMYDLPFTIAVPKRLGCEIAERARRQAARRRPARRNQRHLLPQDFQSARHSGRLHLRLPRRDGLASDRGATRRRGAGNRRPGSCAPGDRSEGTAGVHSVHAGTARDA